jgi:hypothetical protein
MKPRSPSRSTNVSPRKTTRSPSRSDQEVPGEEVAGELETAGAGGSAVTAGLAPAAMAARNAVSRRRQTPQDDRVGETGMATLSGEEDSG